MLSGRKSPELEIDTAKILELEHVASVVEDTVLDYDFDKLKETFDNQMVGRFITAMQAKEPDAVTKKALYYGVDALCRTMRHL